jgi:cytochrome c-type biogenesis protein CcmE
MQFGCFLAVDLLPNRFLMRKNPGLMRSSVNKNIDLSPRAVSSRSKRTVKGKLPVVLMVGALVAGVFVVFQFLSGATVFFCNADELAIRKDCVEGKSIRLQGTVDSGSVKKGVPLQFTVSYANVTVPVVYEGGDPGGIFCEGIPVVVEGIYRSGVFQGDRILTKHTEQYEEANPGRVRQCGT